MYYYDFDFTFRNFQLRGFVTIISSAAKLLLTSNGNESSSLDKRNYPARCFVAIYRLVVDGISLYLRYPIVRQLMVGYEYSECNLIYIK